MVEGNSHACKYFLEFHDRHAVRQRRNPKESADLASVQELMDAVDRNAQSGGV